MKKSIIIMLWIATFMLLGVGICAGWEFDNVKEFNQQGKYGYIEVINAFGLGDTLARYTLDENSDFCFIDCHSQGTVNLYEPNKLFQSIKFEDLLKNLKTLDSVTLMVEVPKTVNYQHDNYLTVCNGFNAPNGTYIDNCTKVYKNTETLSKVVHEWEIYNNSDLQGPFKWRLEAKKKPEQTIDWVVSALGFELDEWAVWQKTDCNAKITTTVTPVWTDANQQLQINLNRPINVTAAYNVHNGTGDELTLTSENNSYFQNIIWTNTSVTAATPFDIETYYNCSAGVSTTDNYLNATMLGSFESLTQEEIDIFTGGGGNAVLNTTHNLKNNAMTSSSSKVIRNDTAPFITTNTSTVFYISHKDKTTATYGVTQYSTSNYATGIDTTTSTNNYSYYAGGAWTATNIAINVNQFTKFRYFLNNTLNGYIEDTRIYSVAAPVDPTRWGYMEDVRGGDSFDSFFVYRDYGPTNPTLNVSAPEVFNLGIIGNPIIQPNIAFYNTNFTCYVNYSGGDGGYVNFTWFNSTGNINTFDTQVTPANNGTQIFTNINNTVTKSKGDTWLCSATAFDGSTLTVLNSTNITIQNTGPTIPTQQYPNNNTYNTTTSIEFKCNSSTDPDNDPVNYEFWGNFTSPLVLLQNLTSENFTLVPWTNGTFVWSCRTNDNITTSNFTTNRSLLIDTSIITIVEELHTQPALSGTYQNYTLNITFNNLTVDSVYAKFVYNNTLKTITRTNYSLNKTLFNSSLIVPLVTSQINNSFYWNVTVVYLNSSNMTYTFIYNQTLKSISINFCTSQNATNIIVYNFTLRDEVNFTLLNGTFEANFQIWNENESDKQNIDIASLSINTSFLLCASPANVTFQSNSHMSYESSGFDRRDYFFRNIEINTSTNKTIPTQNLYLLLTSEVTGLKIILINDVEKPLNDHYLYIQRKNISTNNFYTVAMAHTDINGEAYVPLQFYDAWYKFVAYDSSNTLIKITDEAIIQTTPIYIRVTPTTITDLLQNFDGMDTTLTFNNATRIFTFTFSDSSGAIRQTCMDVRRLTLSENNFTVCSECLSTASGSISCNIGNNLGLYTAITYAKQNPEKTLLTLIYEYRQDVGQQLGVDGVWYGVLLLITISFMFIYNPTTAVIGTCLGLIIIGFMGISSLPYVALISVICSGAVLIATMRS